MVELDWALAHLKGKDKKRGKKRDIWEDEAESKAGKEGVSWCLILGVIGLTRASQAELRGLTTFLFDEGEGSYSFDDGPAL